LANDGLDIFCGANLAKRGKGKQKQNLSVHGATQKTVWKKLQLHQEKEKEKKRIAHQSCRLCLNLILRDCRNAASVVFDLDRPVSARKSDEAGMRKN